MATKKVIQLNELDPNRELLLDLDVELFNEFVYAFDFSDRSIAASIFEEKPTVYIRQQSDTLYVYSAALEPTKKHYYLTVYEFGDNFCIDSGLSLEDAIEVCDYFEFNYVIENT